MKRKLLYLPVWLMGLPILGALLFASVQFDGDTGQSDSRLQIEMENLNRELEQRNNPLPEAAGMEELARQDPIAFLENCIRYYDRDIQGYHLIMQKQERLPKEKPIEKRELHKKEVIEVYFREKPFSVYMRWLEGARKADRVLYVEGENDNQIVVHLAGALGKFLKPMKRKVDGEEAQASGRYTLDKSGIKNGTLRTLFFMKAAKDRGRLDMDYFGTDGQWHPCGPDPNRSVPAVKMGGKLVSGAGGRSCYVLRRHYDQEENDGVWELTIFVDPSNWLQVGSIVEGKHISDPSSGERYLIGEYYFRDIKLNPTFGPDQFKEAAVVPK